VRFKHVRIEIRLSIDIPERALKGVGNECRLNGYPSAAYRWRSALLATRWNAGNDQARSDNIASGLVFGA
jgi:hypothetical protein